MENASFVIANVPLRAFSREDYLARLEEALRGDVCTTVHTVNPEMLVDAFRNPVFAETLARATLAVPDGVGVRYGVLALYGALIAVHPGVDTVRDVLICAKQQNMRVAVFGALPREHEHFLAWMAREGIHPECLCVDPGLIDDRDPHVPLPALERLRGFNPAVLFVALGQGRAGTVQGKQEHVVQELARLLPNARLIMGVGGAIDTLAGSVPRAPLWMRARGLEWMYRVLRQPWRARRIAKAVLVFPVLIALQALRQKRFLPAVRNVFLQVRADMRHRHQKPSNPLTL